MLIPIFFIFKLTEATTLRKAICHENKKSSDKTAMLSTGTVLLNLILPQSTFLQIADVEHGADSNNCIVLT